MFELINYDLSCVVMVLAKIPNIEVVDRVDESDSNSICHKMEIDFSTHLSFLILLNIPLRCLAMTSAFRILPLAAVLAGVLVMLPSSIYSFDAMALIPEDLLELIPDACQNGTDSAMSNAVNCAFGNLTECVGLLQQLETFEEIPPAYTIDDCSLIEDPFCQIASACLPCVEEFENAIRCIVLNDEYIDENITELVDSCQLDLDC